MIGGSGKCEYSIYSNKVVYMLRDFCCCVFAWDAQRVYRGVATRWRRGGDACCAASVCFIDGSKTPKRCTCTRVDRWIRSACCARCTARPTRPIYPFLPIRVRTVRFRRRDARNAPPCRCTSFVLRGFANRAGKRRRCVSFGSAPAIQC